MDTWEKRFAYLPTQVFGINIEGEKFDWRDYWRHRFPSKLIWWRYYEKLGKRNRSENKYRREVLDRYNAWGRKPKIKEYYWYP